MKYLYLVILILILIPAQVRADVDGYGHMMDWSAWSSGFMFIYPLFWILIIGGFIFLLIKGFASVHKRKHEEQSKSALEIIKERYARGEINKDKFEEMRKDIGVKY